MFHIQKVSEDVILDYLVWQISISNIIDCDFNTGSKLDKWNKSKKFPHQTPTMSS